MVLLPGFITLCFTCFHEAFIHPSLSVWAVLNFVVHPSMAQVACLQLCPSVPWANLHAFPEWCSHPGRTFFSSCSLSLIVQRKTLTGIIHLQLLHAFFAEQRHALFQGVESGCWLRLPNKDHTLDIDLEESVLTLDPLPPSLRLYVNTERGFFFFFNILLWHWTDVYNCLRLLHFKTQY